LQDIRIGRMRTLERLGLAEPAGPARWVLAQDAEQRLRELGERGDVIKRLHKWRRTRAIVLGAARRKPW
jgi:type IV secretory pathway VirD2 relaxase